MKIGVFDSGVGGRSVANAIRKALPEHEIIYRQDKKNVPYGSKHPDELLTLVRPILLEMESEGCACIVIACNTVTTTLIGKLRRTSIIPLIGIEPMVKPAVQLTASKVIAICATPTTLASKRYQELKATHARNVQIIEPDCSEWAQMIEKDKIDREQIKRTIEACLVQGADVIVMGCTHYHWIEEIIEQIAKGRATILQPEPAVISELSRVLRRLA